MDPALSFCSKIRCVFTSNFPIYRFDDMFIQHIGLCGCFGLAFITHMLFKKPHPEP